MKALNITVIPGSIAKDPPVAQEDAHQPASPMMDESLPPATLHQMARSSSPLKMPPGHAIKEGSSREGYPQERPRISCTPGPVYRRRGLQAGAVPGGGRPGDFDAAVDSDLRRHVYDSVSVNSGFPSGPKLDKNYFYYKSKWGSKGWKEGRGGGSEGKGRVLKRLSEKVHH